MASDAEFREFVTRLEALIRLPQQALELLRQAEATKNSVLDTTRIFEGRWDVKYQPSGDRQ